MSILSVLPDPSGLYVLSPRGVLGVYLNPYSDEKKFSLDVELSAMLSEQISGFLKLYLANPDEFSARVAIIFNSAEKKPWGNTTFFMEESVVREVYPVAGALAGSASAALTAFQKRNREKSIYRGMESLLEYKTTTNSAIYCPVLYDRNTTLDRYLHVLGREEQEGDRKTPVLEVLNLVANVPVLARNSLAIIELCEKLQAVLIKSHMRKDSGLAVAESGSWQAPSVEWRPRSRNPEVVLKRIPDFTPLHVTDRHDDIERWLIKPARLIDAMSLRGFVNFRSLTDHFLAQIAGQCPLYQAPAGTRLLDHGMTDKWNLFLVQGALLLQPQDSTPLSIESGSDSAANAVSSLKPRKYQVIAKTPVTFMWVPDALLQALVTNGAV